MSIEKTTDNKPVVIVEENILDRVPQDEWVDVVKDTIKEKFSNGIPIKGKLIKLIYRHEKNLQNLSILKN